MPHKTPPHPHLKKHKIFDIIYIEDKKGIKQMNSAELDKIVDNFKEVLKDLNKAIEEKAKKEEQIQKKANLMADKLDLTIDSCVKSFRKALTAVIVPDDPMFANSKHKLTAEEVEECLPDAGCLKDMLNMLADKTIDLAIKKVVDKY